MNKEKFTFFWRSKSPFSQWHKCFFVADGIRFNCAEQYMMYQKAILFGDKVTAEKILKATNPNDHKKLGREVKNFDSNKWEEMCRKIVYKGNFYKFTQNKYLKEKLLATAGTTLVEASPYDKIWGIGLEEEDIRAMNRETWQGTNWLGEVLTRLREDIIEKGL